LREHGAGAPGGDIEHGSCRPRRLDRTAPMRAAAKSAAAEAHSARAGRLQPRARAAVEVRQREVSRSGRPARQARKGRAGRRVQAGDLTRSCRPVTLEFLFFVIAGAAAGGFVNGLAGFGTSLFALGWWLQVMPP